jgi:hypothetical protein
MELLRQTNSWQKKKTAGKKFCRQGFRGQAKLPGKKPLPVVLLPS